MTRNKPYIIIKLNSNDYLIEAYFYSKNGRQSLNDSISKVANIINQFSSDIYEIMDDNKYKISSEEVIREFYRRGITKRCVPKQNVEINNPKALQSYQKSIKKNNKYIGKTIIALGLVGVLVGA